MYYRISLQEYTGGGVLVLNYWDFPGICLFFFNGHSQQVVGKAASILPVIILLELPKKRRIRKQKKKGQLINRSMSQPG